MKKRIFTFLTLLVAFFGLIGLTTNNYKVINAAGDQASVDFDASVAINSVPDTAILSFPVTYESVYGNDIAWTVVANDYITYDETANWMVVKRSTTTDGTAQIIVTVSNGTYEKTEEKTVTIPKGFTSAPIYNIEYDLKDGAFEEGVQVPTSYKLGDASFNLPIPTKTSFVFKGWLDAEGNEVKTILVGSMKSYSLTAQWEAKSIEEIKVTKDPTKIEYKGGETIDLTGIEVTAYYNDETTEVINAEQLTHNEYVNYGETKVELEYQGFTTSFNVTVEKNSWNITFKDKTVTYNGQEHSVTINEELPTAVNVSYENNALTNVGNVEAKVSFSWNTEDEKYDFYSTNYELPTCNPVTLTIEKADLTVTTTAQTVKLSEIANIVWEFEATGFCGEDSIEDVTITPKYYLEGKEVTDFIAGKTYDVEFTGVADNYNVEVADSTLTIATEEVTFEIQGEYKYNGEEQTLVVKAYDANKQEITGVLYDGESSYSQVNAGTYKVTVTLEDEKYGDISQEISFVIAKATATLSVKDTTSVYGEEVKLEYTATGFIESDLEKLNIQLTREDESLNVGEYVVTLTYTDNANYEITKDLEGTHNITPKTATITMTSTTSIYGEEVNLTYTLEGFLESDLEDVNSNVKLSGVKQGDSVGEYTVTAEYQNANYNITINSAKHTITKRTATISVNTSSSTYGDAINLTYTTNNFYGNDLENFNIELSISSTDASEDPYEIKVEYKENPNYTINVESGTHTIAPKPLTNEEVNITVDEGDYNAQNENTLKPGVTIKYGEIEITTHEELEYAYAEGRVGKATITITLTGNYSGTLTAQFEVTEYGQAGVDAALLPNTITEETTELPLTIGSSKVLWGTSNSAFSVDENGIVTVIHPTGDDVKVTLTAEVTYGTTSFYAREYQVVVSGLHRQQSNNVIVDNAEDVTLSVTVGENANYVVTPTEDNAYNTIAAYDISFTNESGEVSTFANPVTVRIPLPANYDANLTYAIWHKVGETYKSVEYTVESGYFVFEATSFSPYIVTVAQNIVTFNANEGTGEMTALIVNKGTTNTLSVNTFSRTGYTFSGWNTQIDGSGTSYTDKEAIKVTENITLYAQWEINSYDINITVNDETMGTAKVTLNEETVTKVTYGSTVALVVTPNEGYEISSILVDGEEKENGSQLVITKNMNIDVTFIISVILLENYYYEFNSKVISSAEQTVDLGEINWVSAATGEKEIDFFNFDSNKGQQVGKAEAPAKLWTLTSSEKYKGVNKIVVFASGASAIEGSISVAIGETNGTCELTELDSTNTKYEFIFNENVEGQIKIILTQTSEKALYMKAIAINPIYATITFIANNDTDESSIREVIKGSTFIIPECNYSYEKHAFNSWQDSNGASYLKNEKINIYEDTIFTAQWDDTVTITYKANNETEEEKIINVVKGEEFTLEANTFNYASHEFKGWESDGQTYTSGSKYTANEDTTFIATWESTDKVWYLVTNVSELKVGDQIIIAAKDSAVALSTNQKTSNRGQATITKDGKIVTFGDDVQIITLENGKISDTFAFNVGNGYLYAASSSSNHLKTETTLTNNSSWTITITSEGVATIKAKGENTRNWLRYNSASNNGQLFSCYSSGQADICIYKYGVVEPEPTYTIKFNANGGSGEMDDQIIKANETLNKNKFTYDTLEFKGWSTSVDDEVEYADQANIGEISKDLTLYAVWGEKSESPIEAMKETTYSFSSYATGTQYAQGEKHKLDDNTELIINGAHLNAQVRLYEGSNAVIECSKTISVIKVTAGYKVGTLTIYASNDGSIWTEVEIISTTTTYTDYEVDLNGNYNFVKMESAGAQIRVSELTINPNS